MQEHDALMALLAEINERLKRLEERKPVEYIVNVTVQPDTQEQGRKVAEYIAHQMRMSAGRQQ